MMSALGKIQDRDIGVEKPARIIGKGFINIQGNYALTRIKVEGGGRVVRNTHGIL